MASRNLLVPNIKNYRPDRFCALRHGLRRPGERARTGKLTPDDFQGTTISLTNPGTVGTMASKPRLISGQGAIIAVGAMDYPPNTGVCRRRCAPCAASAR